MKHRPDYRGHDLERDDRCELQLAAVEQTYNLWARGVFQAVDNISRGRGVSAEQARRSVGLDLEGIRDVSLAILRTSRVRQDGAATYVDVPVITAGGEEIAILVIAVADDFPGLSSTWLVGVRASQGS